MSREGLRRSVVCSSLVWLGIAGCVDEEPGADPLVAAQDWCSALCGLLERCGGQVDPNCTDGCLSWSRAYLRRTVGASVEAEATCFQAARECGDGADPVLQQCFEQAGLAASPSRESDQFCAHMSQTFFECSWFESPDSCSQSHARYTAPALSAGEACSGKPCEELQPCIEAFVWRYGE